jgi:hypothetical protein
LGSGRRKLPKLPDQARQPLGPDPHLERVLLHVDPLEEELDGPRLLGGPRLSRRAVVLFGCRLGLLASAVVRPMR